MYMYKISVITTNHEDDATRYSIVPTLKKALEIANIEAKAISQNTNFTYGFEYPVELILDILEELGTVVYSNHHGEDDAHVSVNITQNEMKSFEKMKLKQIEKFILNNIEHFPVEVFTNWSRGLIDIPTLAIQVKRGMFYYSVSDAKFYEVKGGIVKC